MGSNPSTKTVKKTPYKYDDWYGDWASGLTGVLSGQGGNPGLFDIMSSGNRQYQNLNRGFQGIYDQVMDGYRRTAGGQLDANRLANLDANMNTQLKQRMGDALSEWADKGVMGGTTVSDAIGEIGKEFSDAYIRNYSQLLNDQNAAYQALMGGYSAGTSEALKPYSTLAPIAEAYSRIHGDYYNDPQDTVVSGGK